MHRSSIFPGEVPLDVILLRDEVDVGYPVTRHVSYFDMRDWAQAHVTHWVRAALLLSMRKITSHCRPKSAPIATH